ncbi:MAG: tyrosine-type recombinase/integrase [Anaerolineae bacterium]|nr:tyrosine-type recombinase/integrase [Anaerolineae bacterium]
MLQETKGTHERTDKITIDESIERFCRWLQRRSPSATTHVHYRSDLRIFFEWAKKPPAQISLQDVDRFIAYAQDEKRYAVATINRKMACLKSFFDYLQVESIAPPKNPVHPKRHFLRRAECLPRDVEDATLQKLFEVVTQPRDRAMYLLMLRCGLRLDEVRNLNLSDLYLQPSHGALPRIFVRGKGNKERVAFIAEQTLNALQAWLAVRPVVAEQAVFLNRWHTRYSTTGIRRHLGRYCKRAGLWFTCHQFRHTFGRHLAEQRVAAPTIQRLLGHARLETSQRYIHINDTLVMDDYNTAMSALSERLPLPALLPPPMPEALGQDW